MENHPTHKSEIPFKESSATRKQFYKDDNGNWVRCNENMINSLWKVWMVSPNAKSQFKDSEGYTVFEFKQ